MTLTQKTVRVPQVGPARFITPFRRGTAWPLSLASEFERLKNRLADENFRDTTQSELGEWARRAMDDAASSAWATPFPLLFLPVLVDEKIAESRLRVRRQRQIRARSYRAVRCLVRSANTA